MFGLKAFAEKKTITIKANKIADGSGQAASLKFVVCCLLFVVCFPNRKALGISPMGRGRQLRSSSLFVVCCLFPESQSSRDFPDGSGQAASLKFVVCCLFPESQSSRDFPDGSVQAASLKFVVCCSEPFDNQMLPSPFQPLSSNLLPSNLSLPTSNF
ncbi:MAG: hypothetical protein EOM83_02970 [Clostridia bacterium]|nr:hypothetical protein [Clostridia bacterium]